MVVTPTQTQPECCSAFLIQHCVDLLAIGDALLAKRACHV